MITQKMTPRAYQALCARSRCVQTIETDGLLIAHGFVGERAYVALHPFAGACVTVMWSSAAPDATKAAGAHRAPPPMV